jgi:hypothetical protein
MYMCMHIVCGSVSAWHKLSSCIYMSNHLTIEVRNHLTIEVRNHLTIEVRNQQ